MTSATHLPSELTLSGHGSGPGAPPRTPPAPAFPEGFNPQRVPRALRDVPQWVNWRYELRDNKWNKVPVQPGTSRRAKSTDPATWSTFDRALAVAQASGGAMGVGFVFTKNDPFTGVDFDDCRAADGVICPAAMEIIQRLASYTEVSPSGTGVKCYVVGAKPAWVDRCKSQALAADGVSEIEVYDHDRYFAVTGQPLEGAPSQVNDAQAALDDLCVRLWGEPKPIRQSLKPVAAADLDDDAVIKRLCKKAKTKALWEGDTSAYGGDESRADLALCGAIARLVGGDPTRIDALFRRSGLMRDKWERQDYRDATIERAVAPPAEPPPRANPDAPEVIIDTEEHRVTDECVRHLALDTDLYCRGPALARVIRAGGVPLGGLARAAGTVVIADVPTANLRDRLTRWVRLQKLGPWGPYDVHPPGWLVASIEARGSWPGLRELVAVSPVPTLRPDGTICQESGYDPVTGVLHDIRGAFPAVPDNPTPEEARAALGEVLDVVQDFRFEALCHQAAFVAMTLTLVGRFAFLGCVPLFLVDANIRGAGKGLLCQVSSEIALGRAAPISSMCGEQDELRKRITASAIAGDRVVVLDNLDGPLGSGTLDAMLTSARWKDRVLGENRQVDLPMNTVWLATGNNVTVVGDTARRTVHIRLDVVEERPEDRTDFAYPDLLRHVRASHPRLLSACLTVLRGYFAAGRPSMGLTPMGSFEGWSGLVRNCVVWAGLPDPCSGRDRMVLFTDSGLEALGLVIRAFRELEDGAVVADLLGRLYPSEGPRPIDDWSASARAALEQLVGGPSTKPPTARQVGNRFRHYRRRTVGGWYLDFDPSEKRRGGAVWRAVCAGRSATLPVCKSGSGRLPDSGAPTAGGGAAPEAEPGALPEGGTGGGVHEAGGGFGFPGLT